MLSWDPPRGVLASLSLPLESIKPKVAKALDGLLLLLGLRCNHGKISRPFKDENGSTYYICWDCTRRVRAKVDI